ncbi:MAG: DedA family protein [Phycisphaerae bacterium]|nr:DedA family protein [Phycisphaerae bacterium]
MQALIEQYGYPILFLGTLLEGETVLVLAGFAARRGYLDLPFVILCAFLGSLCGDQLWFYIGRWKGLPFIERRPHWAKHVGRVRELLARYEIPVLVGFRFLYGLRNPTPFVVGASGYSPLKFLGLNAIGAALWATTVGSLGYAFGHAFEVVLEEVAHYELWVFGALALVAVVVIVWRYRRPVRPDDGDRSTPASSE